MYITSYQAQEAGKKLPKKATWGMKYTDNYRTQCLLMFWFSLLV